MTNRESVVINQARGAEIAAFGVLFILTVNLMLITFLHSSVPMSPRMADENGLLEVSQQVVLGLAGILFAISFVAPSCTRPKLRSLLMVATVTTFLLRETDVPSHGVPAWLGFWLDEGGKKILLVALWLLCIHYVMRSNSMLLDIRNFFIDQVVVWLLAAAAFFAISWLLDRSYLQMTQGLFFEECVELVAYGFVSLAAIECAT